MVFVSLVGRKQRYLACAAVIQRHARHCAGKSVTPPPKLEVRPKDWYTDLCYTRRVGGVCIAAGFQEDRFGLIAPTAVPRRRDTMTTPFRFEGISLPVSDVAASVAFYRALGFTVEQQHDVFALLRLGTGTIGLLRADIDALPRALRKSIHIEMTTDDLDQLYAELMAQGITFYAPPRDRPWERVMSAYDPDGYTVEWAQGLRGHNQPGAASND